MVNRIIYILCLLVFAGCTRDDEDAGSNGKTVPVTFSTAGISVFADTRAAIPSSTPFEIVAYTTGVSPTFAAAGNYTANSSGVLTGSAMTLAIGSYDFYVYTTKSGTVTRTGTSVSGIPHGMDFYAKKITEPITGASQQTVDFGELKRLCSKLTFLISCVDNKSFTMNSITINDIAAGPASFTLGGSALTGVGTANGTHTLCTTGDFSGSNATSITADAIILPGATGSSYTLTFNASVDGGANADYTATLSTPASFVGGEQYNYTVTLNDAVGITLSVSNWTPDTWASTIGTPPPGTILEEANSYIINPMTGKELVFYIPVSQAKKAIAQAKDLNSAVSTVPATGWTAEMLWQTWDAATANSTLAVSNYDDTYIKVTVPVGVKAGNNAVIAIRDAGNILWSWHLWITDYSPLLGNGGIAIGGELHRYGGDAFATGGKYEGKYMMDRNLGATWTAADGLSIAATMTSGTTAGDEKARRAYGLMYQWGRKDPFPGHVSTDATGTVGSVTVYNGTGGTTTSHSYAFSNTSNNLAVAIKNPMTHYCADNSTIYDWYTDINTAAARNDDLWGATSNSKSCFDPCPPGWRVPLGSATVANNPWDDFASNTNFERFHSGSVNTSTTSGNTAGHRYNGNGFGNYAWYPAAGRRGYNSGAFANVGSDGYCWGAAVNGYSAYGLSFSTGTTVNTTNTAFRAFGMPVRCVQQ